MNIDGLREEDDRVRGAATDALLALADRGDRQRRGLVKVLIPRIEGSKSRALMSRQLNLLGRLTRLELRSYPGMTRDALIQQLDAARLWLARRR